MIGLRGGSAATSANTYRVVERDAPGVQIRVFCRVRPAPDSAVACSSDGSSLRLAAEDGKEHAFSFDAVFGAAASQADIFSQVSDMVQSALDGYKVQAHCMHLHAGKRA